MRGLLLYVMADEWLFLAVVGVVRCNRARLTNNPSPIKKCVLVGGAYPQINRATSTRAKEVFRLPLHCLKLAPHWAIVSTA
jgi:hypothetical protein